MVDFTKLSQTPDLYRQVYEYDLVEKLEPLLKAGFRFRREDGKLYTTFSYVWDTPWITICRDPIRDCLMWHQILFRFMDVVPSFCLNCWKVVARPNTLEEVFKLHDLMLVWNRPSKIGIEVRAYVQSLYGAYWYNNTIEQGKECLEFVKTQIHKHISPDIDVHLKRYCTEFELKYGDSDKFVQTDYDKKWEKVVSENICFDECPNLAQSPAVIKQHIIRNIIDYAAKMKDPTAHKFNEGNQPMPHIVKYGRDSRDPNLRRGADADSSGPEK